MDTTDKLLAERATTHGNFTTHALITQDLKRIMGETRGWQELTPVQREGLEMIQHKIGRILNGNSHHRDHWDDIAGYARLCSERCTPKTSVKQIEALVRAQVKPETGLSLRAMHEFDYVDEATPNTGRPSYEPSVSPAEIAAIEGRRAKRENTDDVNGVSHSER